MVRRVRLVCAVVCACAGVLAVLVFAGAAQARVVKLPDGRVIGVQPARGVPTPAGVRTPQLRVPAVSSCDTTTDSGLLTYRCGPVVHSSDPYLIFWDPSSGISSASESLLERYLTDTSTSGTMPNDVYGVVRQYFDSTGYAGQSQTFSSSTQAFVDTQAFPTTGNCSVPSGYTTCLTDTQVQTEISRLITAEGWPSGGTSTNAPVYFVVLPQSVDECAQAGVCADNYFCAYHSSYVNGGAEALYAVIPLALLDFGKGCQYDGNSAVQEPNGDPADEVLDSLSHEYNETVTDPVGGTGWYDPTDNAEIGDLCAAYGPADPAGGTDPNAYLPTLGGSASAGTLYDQLIHGDQYYTQTEWSNGATDCKSQPGGATLTPVISAPSTGTTGNAVTFDPTASTAAAGVSSATWDFGDGTTAFASGPLAAISHTYSAVGPYTVKLTLVDDQGDVQQTTHDISIGSAPTAAFSMPSSAPVGTAVSLNASASSDSNSGGSIVSYAWNFGDGTPTGTGKTPTHTFTRPGSHIVSLTVTDNFGFQSAATTHTLTITSLPLVAGLAASPTKVLTSQAVSFSAVASSDPNAGGSITGYRWNFGDGTTGVGQAVSHAYSKPGIYTAGLTVSDPYGLTASRSLSITVVVFPKISRVFTSLKSHLHYLHVTVNQAGKVTAARGSATLAQPGTAVIKLKLTRFQLKQLAAHHSVKLHVTIVFTPAFGPVVKLVKTIKLKR